MALRGRRLTAWTSLLALVVGLAMPMLPGLHTVAAAADDCAATGQADEPRRIGAGGAAASAGDHCVMCHWLRTARSARVGLAASADVPVRAHTLVPRATVQAVAHLLVFDRPSRAPPLG